MNRTIRLNLKKNVLSFSCKYTNILRLKLVKLVYCTMYNGKLFHCCGARYLNKLQIALLIT